jgi:hypothetical protein
MNARHVAVGVLVIALIAWALYMALTVAAFAHTLPMSEVRRGITEAVRDKFPYTSAIVGLHGCRRIDAHGGQCAVRVYTMPARDRWCGVGWAKLIGKSDYMRAHGDLAACPPPHGARKGGNPITA